MFISDQGQRIVGALTLGFAIATVINFFRRVGFQFRAAKPELYWRPHI
jgi:hypothetical protein